MAIAEPLSFPDFHVKANALGRFLRDVPMFGIDARARRAIAQQLIARPADIGKLWPPELRRLAGEVSQLIQAENRWPSSRFIPADPCAIVFWDNTMEMRIESIMGDMSDKYSLPDSFFDDLWDISFGELILRLSRIKAV